MKYLSSYLIRAIFSIVIGILLIKSPGSIPTGLTMLAGFLFLLSGIISCSSYLTIVKLGGDDTFTGEKRKPVFPIVGIGSLLFGAIMVFSPEFFVRFLMYIFGGLLVLGAINEYMVLTRMRRVASISAFFWIIPSLILLSGLVILFKPMATAELPFVISGWCLLLYGISEIINAIKLYTVNKNIRKIAEQNRTKRGFSDVEDFEKNIEATEVKDDNE